MCISSLSNKDVKMEKPFANTSAGKIFPFFELSDVGKRTPPWASSETPRNLSRPSLRDIQMQEIDAPSAIRSIQIEEKAMKDLGRFYSSVKGTVRTKNLTVKMKLFDAPCHLQDKRVFDEASQLISALFSCRCYQLRSQWNLRDWDLVKEMGETYPSVVPCFGLHPCDTDESGAETENFLVDAIESSDSPLLGNETARDEKYFGKRRKIASWSIALVCIGVLGLASAASAERLPSFPRFTICGVSAVILLGSLITLGYIDEDEERHNFGHKGGFLCPFVPYLPVLCILINTYLIINIGWDMDQGLGMATYWKHDLSLLWPISQLTEQCGLRSKDDLYQKNNRSSCLRLVVQCSS
ncbi:hypothetical protein ARALYDRAFT_920658 [Arabidopsis lyrata subsp. lyrata]|uniref:Cationic amino acid transporter C-terminal domain-containing protein n=1 Tax=Arabidopsis lyrata subsp. lyrata TaxID=81972 RepID=D7MXJ1_ARALL|nr:hypothetical protein ARALYDRAFT_920658 [Arabidopsis lyrata subsp. lyrata]